MEWQLDGVQEKVLTMSELLVLFYEFIILLFFFLPFFFYRKVLLNVPSQINVTIFEIANTNDNVCTKFRAELYCPGMDGFICKSDYGKTE